MPGYRTHFPEARITFFSAERQRGFHFDPTGLFQNSRSLATLLGARTRSDNLIRQNPEIAPPVENPDGPQTKTVLDAPSNPSSRNKKSTANMLAKAAITAEPTDVCRWCGVDQSSIARHCVKRAMW